MTAFYLGNQVRLFPRGTGLRARAFLTHMGERSQTWRDRAAALFTIFAFFFAGLTFFYFYIAYQNSITEPAQLDRLPSTPAAVLLYVVALGLAFVTLTYRAYAAQPLAAGKGAGE